MFSTTVIVPARGATMVFNRLISSSGVKASAVAFKEVERVSDRDYSKTFYADEMLITPARPHERSPLPDSSVDLKFGHFYADHMIEVDWTAAEGWHRAHLHKMAPLQIHPGAKVLHYAIELFEGMKAYRGVDNKIRLFRPDMNMARMNRTAKRATLPEFDSNELIKMICEQVRIDSDFVPASLTSSLYIRPTLIGTDKTLGVGHPNEAKLFVITGPVGSYFSNGFQPVSLLADSQYIRAFPGGVGAFKMGCNYAPTIGVGLQAQKKGCQQVVWLYGDNEEITEVGTMNIFVYWKNEAGEEELVTPPLDKGLILPGVTRDSLLALARDYNQFKVSERPFTMGDIRKALQEKRLLQMFGAGTACVVSPVGRIVYHNRQTDTYEELNIPTMESKPNLMQRFYNDILDIQYGRQHREGWMVEV